MGKRIDSADASVALHWILPSVLLTFILFANGCSSSTGAIPSSPDIDKPEITSMDGSFVLSWNSSPAIAPPRKYEYQRYRDGALEHSSTLIENTYAHGPLGVGTYDFNVRACGSNESCSGWSSVSVTCEQESEQLFCWQPLLDDGNFVLPGRAELGGADVEVWDFVLKTTEEGCSIPIRAIRKAGLPVYAPLVFIHGGAWNSEVIELRQNGGVEGLYDYKNRTGLATRTLMNDDPAPVFDRYGRYNIGATFAGFASDKGLLVSLLNENFLIFDVEYIDMNASPMEDDQCQGRWQDVVGSAAEVVEALFDPAAHQFSLPVGKLAPGLPVLMGESAGGHLAHYITSHQPEKVSKTINLSGPLSWRQYQIWKEAGSVQYSLYFEEYMLSTVADPAERARLSGDGLDESLADIVDSAEYFIPQALSLNSFDGFYHQYGVDTPPVYHVNFAHDLILAAGSDDRVISASQGEFFCRYTSGGTGHTPALRIESKTAYNSRRLIDCGGGNYLDQIYDDPDEPEDHLALIRAHAAMTLSQWRAVQEWLRFDVVSTASW